MPRTLRPYLWSLMALGSVGIAIYALRYLFPGQAFGDIAANRFANPMLPIHAGAASLALLVGAFQFLRRKGSRARASWHRKAGAVYMAGCLVSAPAGFLLAMGSTSGPIASTGFGLLAVVWFYTTLQGLRAVLAGRYAEHGEWMLRSFALTFAAVTLRIYLPAGMMLGLGFLPVYLTVSFLCWIPNLMVAETMIVLRRRGLTTTAPA